MSTLAYVLLFSVIGGVFSLAGGIILVTRKKDLGRLTHVLAAFAAGALLGAAFFDLLPEALHASNDNTDIFAWTLGGILAFFLVERFIHWFHHHHEHDDIATKPTAPLIIFGDTMHNFIDGLVIGGAFLVNVPLGIVTSIAVALHEIPQEIGDFAVLLHRGMAKRKVLLFNIMSASATIVGALLAYATGSTFPTLLAIFLAVTAGFFIYIAVSDLMPEIHHHNRRSFAVTETAVLILGVVIMWYGVQWAHQYIEPEHQEPAGIEQLEEELEHAGEEPHSDEPAHTD